MKKIYKILSAFLMVSVLSISLIACGTGNKAEDKKADINKETAQKKEDANKEVREDKESSKESDKNNAEGNTADNEKEKGLKTVKLYFSDEQAEYLVEESREIEKLTPKTILEELLKGPKKKNLNRTLDKNIKLRDVEVKDGIALVDFDKNVQGKIQGSTGERMAMYSISNSLILNKELNIKAVEFLMEGKKIDSLGGHIVLEEPVKENIEIIKK
ncbi:GerMN domain-containing protein [Hathewaya histolytica]|uniref:GerMN domain-containing protein n=1 Tax=Hathewaya histolytica TaxID=1498 RepID=UPI003B67F9A0